MRVYQFLSLTMLLSSCSLLKNTSKTVDDQSFKSLQKSSMSVDEQKNWSAKSASLVFSTDSAHRDYSIQLWPKGPFTFSADKGFNGEAERILIYGNSAASKSSAALTSRVELDQGKTKIESQSSKQVVSEQKERVTKQSVSWKVLIAGLLIIAIPAWYLFKKKRS